MNQLIYALTLVLALSANVAQAMEYDSPYTEMIFTEMEGVKPNSCLRGNLLGMNVVKKLNANTYELVMVVGSEGAVARGVLITTKSTISGEGVLDPKILVRYRGVKLMKLENGFDAKFGAWEECK